MTDQYSNYTDQCCKWRLVKKRTPHGSLTLTDPRKCFTCFTVALNILIFKGNGDHSEVRDKVCSNFQNMPIT